MAERIQRKRTKGWRMPDGSVYVGRPTRWGNPYRAGVNDTRDREHAVDRYREWLARTHGGRRLAAEARFELAGRDLACWCPLDQPCHADVLLQVANETPPNGGR